MYIISSYIQSYIIWCIILYILSKYQIFYIYIRYIQCLVSRQFPQHPQERNASEPRPSKGSAYPAPASSSSNEGAAQRWATVFFLWFLDVEFTEWKTGRLPGNLSNFCYWKWPFISELSHWKRWFSIAMLNYQRVVNVWNDDLEHEISILKTSNLHVEMFLGFFWWVVWWALQCHVSGKWKVSNPMKIGIIAILSILFIGWPYPRDFPAVCTSPKCRTLKRNPG